MCLIRTILQSIIKYSGRGFSLFDTGKLDLEKIRFKGNFQKLIDIAQDPQADQRVGALHQLGLMQTDKVIPVAIQLFRDPDPHVQNAASLALVQLGASAVPSLISAYKSHSDDTSKWVEKTLLKIGPDAADILITSLPRMDQLSQERTSYTLISMGPSILPKLVQALGHHDGDGERIIEAIIENIGAPSVPYLLDALKSSDEELRSLAAVELVMAGPRVIPDILQSCSDDTPQERQLKYYIISQIGTPALDRLYACLKSANPVTVSMAVEAFVEFGDSATAPLITGLFEQNSEIQQSAENAIIRIGEPIVTALIYEIPARKESEQEQLVRLLSKIGQPALPAMVNALAHPSPAVTKNMVTGIAAMGALGTPLLLEKVLVFDEKGEKNITKVFKLIGKSTLALLEEAVVQPNEKIAIFSLGMIKDIDPIWAIDPLVTAFSHPNPRIREKAVSCLLEIGDLAIPRLIGVLSSDDSDAVPLAKKAIIDIGGGAAPHLVDAYGDPYGPPEALITDILQQIGIGSLDYVVQLLSTEPPRLDIGKSYLINAGAIALPAVMTVFDSANAYMNEQGRKVLSDIYANDPSGYVNKIPTIQSKYIKETYAPIIADEANSFPLLLSLLFSEDERSEFLAREIMDEIGHSIVPSLIQALRETDEEQTEIISNILAGYGDSVVDVLILTLYNPELHGPKLQKAASITLSKIPSSIPKLLSLLSEQSGNVAYYAGSAIANSGKDGVALLIQSFRDDDNPVTLARTLSEVGSAATHLLLSALSDLTAQGLIGSRRAIGLMQSLIMIALVDEQQMHVLFGLSETDKELVHIISTIMIREGERVLDPLLKALLSWKGESPGLIYEVFSKMKREAVEKLHVAIADIPTGDTRKVQILHLLGFLNDTSSSPILLECLEDPSDDIRLVAVRGMGKYGRGALKPLQKAAKDSNLEVQAAAVVSMGQIGLPAIDSLLHALKSPEIVVRNAAVDGIGKIGDPAKIMLVQALTDKDRHVRKNVVSLLDNLSWQPKYTIDRLDYLYATEDWGALVKLGPSAVDVLQKGLHDNDKEVRSKSEDAIRQIRDNFFPPTKKPVKKAG
jgi:HEAT repeat protein